MLQKIFTDLRCAYAIPFANQRKSGNHAPDFWGYCDGNKEILYLHEMINGKGCHDLHNLFAAVLPKGMVEESIVVTGVAAPKESLSTKGTLQSSRKRAKQDAFASTLEAAVGKIGAVSEEERVNRIATLASDDKLNLSQIEMNTCTLKAQYTKQMEVAEQELLDVELTMLDWKGSSTNSVHEGASREERRLRLKFLEKQRKNKVATINDCSTRLLELNGGSLVGTQQAQAQVEPTVGASSVARMPGTDRDNTLSLLDDDDDDDDSSFGYS